MAPRPGGLSGQARQNGRRFGLAVGGVFAALAAVASWRGRPATALVLGSVGGLLILGGLVVPGRMGPVERGWMAVARAISTVTTPVVLGIMYLVVLTPVGLLRRAVGRSPLVHRLTDDSYWKARPADRRRSDVRRQF
jgi:hypothetical protein